MKEDNLEKFVRDNRMAFDDLEPSMELWNKINPSAPKKVNWFKIVYSVAASVALLIGAYFIFNMTQNDQKFIAQQPKVVKEINDNILKEDTVKQVQIEEKQLANVVVNKKKTNTIKNEVIEEPVNNELTELAEATQYYSIQIENKKEEILNCVAYDPEIDSEILNEFTPLDAAFNDLKKDLNDNANNTRIMEAMIQNYRTKLEILSDIKNQICMRE